MNRVGVVVDTNVVVAAFLTTDIESPVVRILDGLLAAKFPYVLSAALLAEYRDVLLRDRIRARHKRAVSEVESILVHIAQNAIVLAPAVGPPAPEPGDRMLWDLLAARADLLLVTGDKLLFGDRTMRGRIVSAREFVLRLSK